MGKRRWGLAGGIMALGAAAAIYAGLSSKPPPAFYFSGYAASKATGQDMCDVAYNMGLLTGDYFCLRGDGGSISGMSDGGTAMALTAVGSPTTQTLTQTPCGPDGCQVTGQRLRQDGGAGEYFKTGNVASPAGDFSYCYFGTVENVTGFKVLGGKDTGGARTWLVWLDAASLWADVTKDGSTANYVSASASAAANAPALWCLSYDSVTDGTSAERLYVNGAAAGTPTTTAASPPYAQTVPVTVAERQDGWSPLPGAAIGTLYTGTALSAAQIQALASSLGVYAPSLLQGSRGEAITFTRASAATCTASDGTVSGLPRGRPCVTQGGYLSEPAGTNSLLQSRDFSNASWVKVSMTCTKTATGKDGVTSGASTCTATAPAATVLQTIVLAAASRTSSLNIKRRTGTGAISILRDGVTPTTLDATNCFSPNGTGTAINSSTWVRCRDTSSQLNPVIGLLVATSGDAIDIDYTQDEAGAVATSEIPTTTVAVTREATAATFANPLYGSNPSSWCIGATANPVGGTWTGLAANKMLVTLNAASGANHASLSVLSTGKVEFVVRDAAAAFRYYDTDAAISAGAHTIYGCNSGGVMSIWVDGVQPAKTAISETGTGIIATQGALASFGSNTVGGDNAGALVSNVKILNRGTP